MKLASNFLNDSDVLQQNAASQLALFHDTIQAIRSLFTQLAADKGLQNYDRTNELETMLKNVINANKNALTAVDNMIYNIPTLGPILGPSALFKHTSDISYRFFYAVVYDLKCLIDDILNATENITDGILNSLKPLLLPLLSGLYTQANDMTCASQLKILGFCL